MQETKKARLANKELSITIVTTLDCNMQCYYCFIKKNKQYLSSDKSDEIINFIISQLTGGEFEKLNIIWTGGEPLLHRDIIEYISTPIIKFCCEKKINYHGSLITNGLLLTESQA